MSNGLGPEIVSYKISYCTLKIVTAQNKFDNHQMTFYPVSRKTPKMSQKQIFATELHNWTNIEFEETRLQNVFSILDDDHEFYLTDNCTSAAHDDNKNRTKYHPGKAALIIQQTFRKYLYKKNFSYIRNVMKQLNKQNTSQLLKRVSRPEAELFDKSNGNYLAIRLCGESFPPSIVYKIFTTRHVVNLEQEVMSKKTNQIKKESCGNREDRNWKVLYQFTNLRLARRELESVKVKLTGTIRSSNQRRRRTSQIKWISEMYGI